MTRAVTKLTSRLAGGTARFDLAIRVIPLVLLAGLLTAVTVEKPYRFGPPIRDDGAGYHAWTRAIVNWEFSFCAWEAQTDLLSYVDRSRGMCQNKYAPGLALLHLPFMVPLLDSSPNAPLISSDEHEMCLALGALTLWIIAALLTWSASLLNVPPWRSILTVVAVVFGTGLFHYATFDAGFSHIHSGLFVAVLLTLAIRERERGRPMPPWLLAVCGFFMVAIRLTSVILLVELAAAYLAWNRHRLRDATRWSVLPAAIGGGAAIALQLAYNYHAQGRLSLSSYGEESFLFDRPMQMAVLASYERGLFTYFPVFAAALALGFAVPAARGWTALLAVQIGSLVLLYGFWHSWMLGGGMGHRGFVELGPVAAIVLLVALRALPRTVAVMSVAAIAACGLVTVQVMLGYWRGSFPMGGATSTEYWRHLRTIESTLSGGTQCRPVRCNLLKWRCSRRPLPEFSACSLNFGEPGNCTADGRCAAIVAIKSLAEGNDTPFVTAPPFSRKKNRARPLMASARRIGPWEKFMIVPAGARNELRLQSLHTKRFVALRTAGGAAPTLEASAETVEDAATFVRIGDGDEIALRAPNRKYIQAPPPRGTPAPMTAGADEVGAWEKFALEPTLP